MSASCGTFSRETLRNVLQRKFREVTSQLLLSVLPLLLHLSHSSLAFSRLLSPCRATPASEQGAMHLDGEIIPADDEARRERLETFLHEFDLEGAFGQEGPHERKQALLDSCDRPHSVERGVLRSSYIQAFQLVGANEGET